MTFVKEINNIQLLVSSIIQQSISDFLHQDLQSKKITAEVGLKKYQHTHGEYSDVLIIRHGQRKGVRIRRHHHLVNCKVIHFHRKKSNSSCKTAFPRVSNYSGNPLDSF